MYLMSVKQNSFASRGERESTSQKITLWIGGKMLSAFHMSMQEIETIGLMGGWGGGGRTNQTFPLDLPPEQ